MRTAGLAMVSLLALSAGASADQEQWLCYRSAGETWQYVGNTPGQVLTAQEARPDGVALPKFTGKPIFAIWKVEKEALVRHLRRQESLVRSARATFHVVTLPTPADKASRIREACKLTGEDANSYIYTAEDVEKHSFVVRWFRKDVKERLEYSRYSGADPQTPPESAVRIRSFDGNTVRSLEYDAGKPLGAIDTIKNANWKSDNHMQPCSFIYEWYGTRFSDVLEKSEDAKLSTVARDGREYTEVTVPPKEGHWLTVVLLFDQDNHMVERKEIGKLSTDPKPRLYSKEEFSGYQRHGSPGNESIWFPHKAVYHYYGHVGDGNIDEYRTEIVGIRSIEFNVDIPDVKFSLQFPPGTKIYDVTRRSIHSLVMGPGQWLKGKTLPDLDGFGIQPATAVAAGRPIAVCFCDLQQRPSRHAVTELADKAALWSEKGMSVALVIPGGPVGDASADWLKQHKVPFAVGRLPADEIAARRVLTAWGVTAVPHIALTDDKHVVTAESISVEEMARDLMDANAPAKPPGEDAAAEVRKLPFPEAEKQTLPADVAALLDRAGQLKSFSERRSDGPDGEEVLRKLVALGRDAVPGIIIGMEKAANVDRQIVDPQPNGQSGTRLRVSLAALSLAGDRRALPAIATLAPHDASSYADYSLRLILAYGSLEQLKKDANSQIPAVAAAAQRLLDDPKQLKSLRAALARFRPMFGVGKELPPDESMEELSYEQAFEQLYHQLKTQYPCFKLKGIDWDAVGRELLPRAKKVTTDEQFGLLCMALVARCQDSHAVVRPGTTELPSPPLPKWDPSLACLIDDKGRPVVYYVDKDGPAQRAGIKPGMIVESVNGIPAAKAMARCMELHSTYYGFSSERILRYQAARSFLRQERQGAKVTLGLRSADGKSATLALPAALGVRYLPHLPVPIEGIRDSADVAWKMLDGRVGYIYVRRIRNDLIASLDQAVGQLKDARGLIVDVRGNSGGGFDAGRSFRNFDPNDTGEPDRPRFAGPIALLIDARCISAGEGWASWFIAKGRARAFGEATAGASARKTTFPIKGGLFQVVLPIKPYRGFLDRVIERRGLEPDVTVMQTAGDLAAGRDTALETAQEYLQQEKETPTREGDTQ